VGVRRGHRAVHRGAPQAALPVRPRAAVRRRQARARRITGVDTVIYDTHFLPDEYAKFPHYGHSTPDQAIEICLEAQVRRLVLYHHAPAHSDEQMDRVAAEYAARGAALGLDIVTSYEGLTLRIGPGHHAHTTAPGIAAPAPGRPGDPDTGPTT
jgi:hypothetical protein